MTIRVKVLSTASAIFEQCFLTGLFSNNKIPPVVMIQSHHLFCSGSNSIFVHWKVGIFLLFFQFKSDQPWNAAANSILKGIIRELSTNPNRNLQLAIKIQVLGEWRVQVSH
jgi:hypothetical protein